MPADVATPEQLADAIRACLAADVVTGELPAEAVPEEVPVRLSADPAWGDLTSPVALQLFGPGLDPGGCAARLAARLRELPDLATVEVAGAGHLNVTVRLDALLRAARGAAVATCSSPVGEPEPLTGAWAALGDDVGSDVARWARAQDPGCDPADLDRERLLTRTVDNPAFRVLFAHARGAAALSGASGWRHQQLDGAGLSGPPSRPLLVAVAACAGALGTPGCGPQQLTRRLDLLASSYLAFDATGAGEPGRTARLWLAAATRNQLATGLARLGIIAPERI